MNSAHVRAIERRRCRFRQRRLLSSTSPARSGSTFSVRSGSSSFRIGVFFQTSSRQAFPSPRYDFFELSFYQGQVFQTQGIEQEQLRSHVKGGNVEGDGENTEISKSSRISPSTITMSRNDESYQHLVSRGLSPISRVSLTCRLSIHSDPRSTMMTTVEGNSSRGTSR